MADEERSLLDKILKPTRTESKDFNTILDNAYKFQKYQEKYGIGEGLKKIEEQKELIKQNQEDKICIKSIIKRKIKKQKWQDLTIS